MGGGAAIPHLLTDHKITPLCAAQGALAALGTVSTCADGAPSPFSTPARWRADWDAEYNCEDITQGRASASAAYGDIAADSRYANHVAQERNSKTVIKKYLRTVHPPEAFLFPML